MGKLGQFADGLVNLVANIGTTRDKSAHGRFVLTPMIPAELDAAYRGTWLARKVVDIPALDACRNWRNWNAEADQISAIEAEEARLNVKGKMLETMVKARLFGGAALYIGTGDSNPQEPLNPDAITQGGIKHLNVLVKRVLQAGELDRDPESPNYGKPAYYTLTSNAGQVRIDPSRLVILQGHRKPDPEMEAGDGWGDSILQCMFDDIKRADSTSANIASLVFEAKVDVFKIPNFMAMMSDPDYERQVLQRLQLAAMAKGINGALLMDSEEDYQQKQASFAGLPDVLTSFLQLVSGASDIPLTRLLGQSPGGLNSTGDSDLRNYYDRIRAEQELTIGVAMMVLDECLIRSALGRRPSEVFYNWRSLWQSSDIDRATIGLNTANTIKILSDTKLLPDEVLSTVAVNMLTESGIAPGLESEMQDYTAANPDWQEQQAEDERAALELRAQQTEQLPKPQQPQEQEE